jgi:hypothetical protein
MKYANAKTASGGWLMLVLCTSLALACHKVEHGPAPTGKLEGAAKLAIESLPESYGVMLGISWKQLAASPLWKALEPKLLGLPEIKEALGELQTGCQIDLTTDLGALVVAMPHNMDESKVVLIVQGKWDKAKVHACMQTLFAKFADGAKLDISEEGGVTALRASGIPDGPTLYVAWLADDTLVMSAAGFEGDRTQLAEIMAKKNPLSGDARFMGLMERVDTTDALFMVAARPKSGRGAPVFDEAGAGLNGFYFNLELDLAASGYMGFRFDSGDRAENEALSAKKELDDARKRGQFSAYLANSKVYVSGMDVVFDVKLPRKFVDEMATRLAEMSETEIETQLMLLASQLGGM